MQQLFTVRLIGLILGITMLTGGVGYAQNVSNLKPCGTVSGRSPWLKAYQSKPQDFYKGGDSTLYVAMTIHIVGNDEGVGYYSQANLLSALCKLNELFEPTDIQLFIEGDINYINNSAYYRHSNVHEGAEMMFANNRPNTLNVYFVDSPAGNCGYNLPYAGVANSNSCAGPNDVTWAHEVGHALSLPHPFLGWEGGVSWDGSVDHDFADPAPERVTYNYTFFQDIYFPPDTLIIDTAYVEKLDGSNCAYAADGFCDTSPDYLANRWSCNGNGVSSTSQRDPNGETFNSEGSFVMNYANDACQTRFSEEQVGAMRAFLFDQRPGWLRESGFDNAITEPLEIVYPLDGDMPPANATELVWTSVTNATGYMLQVSRLSSFPNGATESYVVPDTSILLPELMVDRTYYWRVRPFNNIDGCTGFTSRQRFLTGDFVNNVIENTSIASWRILPQPVRVGEDVLIQLATDQPWLGFLQIIAVDGQQVQQQAVQLQSGQQELRISTASLPAGLYIVRLHNNIEWTSRKLLIVD